MALSLGLSGAAQAGVTTGEVTGPVVESCCPKQAARGEPPYSITVQKGKERFEMVVAWNAKMNAQPKVGDMVTVHYTKSGPTRFGGDYVFEANTIEVKGANSSKE